MVTIDGVYRYKPDPALFDTYVQTFDDDYHEHKRELTPFEQELKKIKGVSRNYEDYLMKKSLYEEWKEQLKKEYPNKKIRKLLVKSDALDVIPRKPRYKAKKSEKKLIPIFEQGIVLSGGTYKWDEDSADNYIQNYFNTEGCDVSDVGTVVKKKDDEDVGFIIDREIEKIEHAEKKSKKKKRKKMNDSDLIEELFNIKSGVKFDKKFKDKKKKKKHERQGISIERYRTGKFIKDIDYYDELEANRLSTYYTGTLMTSSEINAAKFYEGLIGSGHNPYRMIKKTSINKSTTKLLKKEKKRKKKEKEFSFYSYGNIDGGEEYGGYEDYISDLTKRYQNGGL